MFINQKIKNMKRIEFEDLKNRLQIEEMNLVEVITKDEYNDTKEERANNIPLDVVGEQATGNFSKEEPIVVYGTEADLPSCQEAAKQLEEQGFKEVYYYTGSNQQWKELGFPVR